VKPGTVASDGVARLGYPNFYLVSHVGIQGTSVPCHYHWLHKDARLEGVTIDDVEEVTYQLCHLYPRADKTVSYAPPAYFADHAAERGKLYLEAEFPGGDSQVSDQEDLQELEKRVDWLNKLPRNAFHIGRMPFC